MKLPSLDRKMFRDLALIRGQALAIAAVIGAGVTLFVLMLSAFDSLDLTQRAYYEQYRFGDVFASLKRAPLSLERDIAEIPGVSAVETRVVADVNLDVPGLVRPAVGRLISIPEHDRDTLCDVYLHSGRYIDPDRPDEVLINESFAVANNLRPGDRLRAVINGRRRSLRVAGLALSPEYIYTIRPGEMVQDDRLFGVIWMGRRALASAFNMEGGFNDVVLDLRHGASEAKVIARLDALIAPYGGLGAIPRRLQSSHFFLQSELDGLSGMGAVIPLVFLAVAAFLLNVVLTRIVSVQREQIAVLKALGYSNRAIGFHYIKWSLIIALGGAVLGVLFGAWMGRGMTRMYADFFHFPILHYRLAGDLVAKSLLISIAAATVGAWIAVRRVVQLPPAVAMRPEPPARYRQSRLERGLLRNWLSQPTRIVLRNLQRHPGRAGLSVVGMAFGGALLIVGNFTYDSIDLLMDIQYSVVQRYDAAITFSEPLSARAYYDVQRLPGVLQTEPYRTVAARLRAKNRSRNVAISGVPRDARLSRIVNAALQPLPPPEDGLILSAKLAEIMDVTPGDSLIVEVLEGAKPVRTARVTGVVDDYMGASVYMRLDALHRMMGEGDSLSGAYVTVDDRSVNELYREIKNTPAIAGATLKGAAMQSFQDTLGETFAMMRSVVILFASIIAFGVVYNSARISLSERSRELATLRVIGFRKIEVAYILIGELVLITLLAIPLGGLLGWLLSAAVVEMYDTEVYRMPMVVSTQTFALSAITLTVSTVLSALTLRRRLNRLDLVSVLKTRE